MEKKVFRKKNGVVTRNVAGETILVPVYGELADIRKIFSVNPVAGFVWDQLDGKCTYTELLDRITRDYDVDRETAGRDLCDLLSSLETWGLIEEA